MIRLLIGPRQYSKRDSKYLQTFVLVILYVVQYISDFSPPGSHFFFSFLDLVHTILCIYTVYW